MFHTEHYQAFQKQPNKSLFLPKCTVFSEKELHLFKNYYYQTIEKLSLNFNCIKWYANDVKSQEQYNKTNFNVWFHQYCKQFERFINLQSLRITIEDDYDSAYNETQIKKDIQLLKTNFKHLLLIEFNYYNKDISDNNILISRIKM